MRTTLRHYFYVSSLQHQLSRQLLLGLSIMLILLVSIIHFSVTQLTNAYVQSRLEHDIDSLVVAIGVDATGQWRINESRISEVYQRPYSGHYFLMQSDAMNFRSRSLWDITLPPASPIKTPGTPMVSHQDGPQDQEWFTLTTQVTKHQQPLTVWIAEDIRPLQTLQWRFELGITSVFAIAIPLLLILQRSIIRRNFRVFDDIHRALHAMHEGQDLVFPSQVPDEVTDLIFEIERALTRARDQLKRSRTSVGNLAHELKRPLQNLRWIAENDPTTHQQELRALSDQLQNLITRELRRAAISGAPTPGKRFHPSEDIPVLQTLLTRQYPKDIQFQTHWPNETLPFDRDDMLELIGNLLDNAWRYALSTVALTVEATEKDWILTIEDDGPGMNPEEFNTLSTRGVSRDEAYQNHAGLGLHICQAVVESYDGTWQLDASSFGGLRVQISLPA